VKPSPFSGMNSKLMRKTIKEFRISKKEQEASLGSTIHKINHIDNNIKLASNIHQLKNIQQLFKRSVLSKSNPQNLHLIRRQLETQKVQSR